MSTRIAVVGTGYVGLSVAVLLARHNEVVCFDIDPGRVEMLEAGRSPIHDEEISAFLATGDPEPFARLGRRFLGPEIGSVLQAGAVVVTAAGTNRGNEVLAHLAARWDVPMAANVLSFAGLSPFTVTRIRTPAPGPGA